MKSKFLMLILALSIFAITTVSYAQDNNEKKDTYTTRNMMLSTIYETPEGLMIRYFAGKSGLDEKYAYIPSKFFDERMAIKITEDDTRVSPQMNVVYKNGEIIRIKLYLAKGASSRTYRLLEFLTKEQVEGFNIDKPVIEF